MQELEAVLHPARLQFLEAAQHLGHSQAKLRSVATRALPAPAAAGRELDAHADLRPDTDLFRVLQDQAELGEFLDHRDDVAPDFLGQHRHFDEFRVLEAVADDRRVVIRLGHDGQELRLGAGLETEPVLAAEVEHFLDHLPLLVHFDRINADVFAVVLVLRDRGAEGVVDVANAVAQDVAEPEEHREPDPAQQQVVGQLLQIDGPGRILRRMHEHVPGRRDREVAFTPAVHLVEIGGVADGKCLAGLPVAMSSGGGTAHEDHNTHVFSECCAESDDVARGSRGEKPSAISYQLSGSFRLKAEATSLRFLPLEGGSYDRTRRVDHGFQLPVGFPLPASRFQLPASGSRIPLPALRPAIPNPESRIPSPESRVPSPESRAPSPSPESRAPHPEVPNPEPPNPEPRTPNPEPRVPSPDPVRIRARGVRVRSVPAGPLNFWDHGSRNISPQPGRTIPGRSGDSRDGMPKSNDQ